MDLVERTINQFMWGFQPHFRVGVERDMEEALSLIGLPVEVRVVLVGFALRDSASTPDLCRTRTWPTSSRRSALPWRRATGERRTRGWASRMGSNERLRTCSRYDRPFLAADLIDTPGR